VLVSSLFLGALRASAGDDYRIDTAELPGTDRLECEFPLLHPRRRNPHSRPPPPQRRRRYRR